jgi:hypothetical protein
VSCVYPGAPGGAGRLPVFTRYSITVFKFIAMGSKGEVVHQLVDLHIYQRFSLAEKIGYDDVRRVESSVVCGVRWAVALCRAGGGGGPDPEPLRPAPHGFKCLNFFLAPTDDTLSAYMPNARPTR